FGGGSLQHDPVNQKPPAIARGLSAVWTRRKAGFCFTALVFGWLSPQAGDAGDAVKPLYGMSRRIGFARPAVSL
ncbi:hypothetical protein LB571_06325, partial [Mesorhizobium sp. BR1-1-4]|nr:hypothetical protein [Mesorhizobium sp. BR1-1-4]